MIWKAIRIIVWWFMLKPILVFLLLGFFIMYSISRWSMTLLLRLWYPGQRFGDWGFNDVEDVK